MIEELRIGQTHHVKARIQEWRVDLALDETQVRGWIHSFQFVHEKCAIFLEDLIAQEILESGRVVVRSSYGNGFLCRKRGVQYQAKFKKSKHSAHLRRRL